VKILHIDASMGASGDMLAGALLELTPDPAAALAELNAMGVPHVEFSAVRAVKCGIAATRLSVKVRGLEEHEHDHSRSGADCCHSRQHRHSHHDSRHGHRSLEEVLETAGGLAVDPAVKKSVEAVYRDIAAAESRAHGKPAGEIHFHEVGALDAIADIAAVSHLMHRLSPDLVTCTPVDTGSGTVMCAHGEMPVPAPATAFLLEGVPSYSSGLRGELCTPTGAALFKRFVAEFRPQPLMRVSSVGMGAGSKDFPRANILRIFSGEAESAWDVAKMSKLEFETDDMTGEDAAFAAERIFAAGAKDVCTSPVSMKKGRPGIRFSVLCREEDRDAALRAVFKHTTTLGVREIACARHELRRRAETVRVDGTDARVKTALRPDGESSKAEFEDAAALALRYGISIFEARARIAAARA